MTFDFGSNISELWNWKLFLEICKNLCQFGLFFWKFVKFVEIRTVKRPIQKGRKKIHIDMSTVTKRSGNTSKGSNRIGSGNVRSVKFQSDDQYSDKSRSSSQASSVGSSNRPTSGRPTSGRPSSSRPGSARTSSSR